MLQQETRQKSGNRRTTRRKSESTGIERKKMNKQAKITTFVISFIFLFMIGYYLYFVVVDSHDILNNPYNHRIDSQSSTVIRGTIYSKNGKKLAYTDTKNTESDLTHRYNHPW